jgi:AhpD family alkylhydroperoxidase
MAGLPPAFAAMKDAYPAVWDSQSAMNQSCDEAGPLDARTRELIKVAVLAAAGHEQSVKGHTNLALEAGASAAEVRQAVLLAAGPVGIPAVAYGLSWVEDALNAAVAPPADTTRTASDGSNSSPVGSGKNSEE